MNVDDSSFYNFALKWIAQVLCGTTAAIPLSSHIPRNAKYLYQDGSFNRKPGEEFDGSRAAFQIHLAVKYLSLVAQRDAFVYGPTDPIFFNIDPSPAQVTHDRRQAVETMTVVAEHPRPNLLLCPGLKNIPVKEAGIDLIAYKLVLDDLEGYGLIVPPETHWYLNSKEMATAEMLPPVAIHAETASMASAFQRIAQAPEASSSRTNSLLSMIGCPVPFVLKNQQTFGGAGTYFARTEDERQQLIRDLTGGISQRLLSSITSSNVHLAPGTLLLSEIVAEPTRDYALTFFVPENHGEPIFLAAPEQMIEGDTPWIGSTIDYRRQGELGNRFSGLIKKIAG
ncbi:Fc.00g105620.m01.CDS01 [Cosmosporella sp. VM-42]